MRLGRGRLRPIAVAVLTAMGLIGGGFSVRAATTAPPPALRCTVTGSSTVTPGLGYVPQAQTQSMRVTLRRCMQGSTSRPGGVATGRLSQQTGSCVAATDTPMRGTFRVRWADGGESTVPVEVRTSDGKADFRGTVTSGRYAGWFVGGAVTVTSYEDADCAVDPINSFTFTGSTIIDPRYRTTSGTVRATGPMRTPAETARAALCAWNADSRSQGAIGWVIPLTRRDWGKPASLTRGSNPSAMPEAGGMYVVFTSAAAGCPTDLGDVTIENEWSPMMVPSGARSAVVVLGSTVTVAGPTYALVPYTVTPAVVVNEGFRFRIG